MAKKKHKLKTNEKFKILFAHDEKKKINGGIALDMQKKSSPFSITVDRKKEANKKQCRVK